MYVVGSILDRCRRRTDQVIGIVSDVLVLLLIFFPLLPFHAIAGKGKRENSTRVKEESKIRGGRKEESDLIRKREGKMSG